MKKRNIIIVVVVSVVIILGLSSFFVYFFIVNPALFIKCQDQPFTEYPVEMSRLKTITPLGNLNPPGHTYPTDHMYFSCDNMLYPDGFEIYSPGAIIINKISKVEYNPAQVMGVTEDFTIDFAVCSKIDGRFGHVNNISTFLSDRTGEFGEEFGDTVSVYEIDGRIYTDYEKRVNIKVPAGQLLGRAGISGGYDFWLKDTRVNLVWVNTDISQYFQHTVCPLDYFTTDLKTNMTAKLVNWDGSPVFPTGYCGKIDFDVPNTAQGIWQRDDWVNENAQEGGLALVYSNFNASEGAISIGNADNSTWDKQVYLFNPATSGFMNRQFDQVTNDGNIYYYFCYGFESGSIFYKVILVKMTNNQELMFQFIDSGSPIPVDPTSLFDVAKTVTYNR